jgi:hypothetical protein
VHPGPLMAASFQKVEVGRSCLFLTVIVNPRSHLRLQNCNRLRLFGFIADYSSYIHLACPIFSGQDSSRNARSYPTEGMAPSKILQVYI